MRCPILLPVLFAAFSLAAPAPLSTQKAELADRDIGLLGGIISGVNDGATPTTTTKGDLLGGVLAGINSAVNPTATSNIFKNILSDLQLVTATVVPIEIAAASSTLSAIINARPTPSSIADVFEGVAEIVEAGLTANNIVDLVDFLDDILEGDNSFNNFNPRQPDQPIYPKADPRDAPYDLPESVLRGAIHIPAEFRYGAPGAPQPVILVPGTGATGFLTFIGNFIPLLRGSNIADPVWLNIPGYLLNDAQANAEFVAYAIGYISGISGCRAVAVTSWSQGGIDAQWAYKYWPSTRGKVTDQVAISPDYHGTVLANFITTLDVPFPPAILQQEYNSNFITTLRADGGDSAYVPTTTIYSGFLDEIVEPQQGTGASAYLLDARGVGVSNNEVQTVCRGGLAGTFYTHEGVLYNPLAFALFVDALTHDGPGRPERLDLAQVCATYLTPGLDLTDFLLTENTIPIAGFEILVYPSPTTVEPPIKRESIPDTILRVT